MWKKLKAYPPLRAGLAALMYAQQGNRRRVQGKHNTIQIETSGTLPFLQQVTFEMGGEHNTIVIAPGVQLRNTQIQIHGSHNRIVIGAGCQIQGGHLWINDDCCRLEIGANTTIAGATIGLADPHAEITIGSDCMLSHDIDIRCGDSHAILDLRTDRRINLARYIHIDDHVWLGMQVRVLKNVRIGHNSVIAAGSIVTKDIPACAIAAGVPAAVKRQDITWSRVKVPMTIPQEELCYGSAL
ncbi:hypothetical protein BST81_21460 [Leptolyngbya sp. 'hensonii']|nr:hypothetical protein BST81_21460 [Leptolyngbya sp. 'hensonii']